jgi:hypothetical protein
MPRSTPMNSQVFWYILVTLILAVKWEDNFTTPNQPFTHTVTQDEKKETQTLQRCIILHFIGQNQYSKKLEGKTILFFVEV